MKKLLGALLIFGVWWLPAPASVGAWQAVDSPAQAERETDRLGLESVDGFARAELAFWQTLHGILLGVEACAVLECNDLRAGVGATLVGGGTGLGLSLWATQDGITPGRAHLLNSATGWGLWNALAAGVALGIDDGRAGAGLLMAGQLGGLGAAAALWPEFRPQAGDVGLVNTGGIWSGVLTGFAMGALEARLDEHQTFGLLLAATDLGGVAGAALASAHPMGRGRVLVLNAGGVVGALAGFGLALLVGGEGVGAPAFYGAGIAGTITGLALGAWLTQDWALMTKPK